MANEEVRDDWAARATQYLERFTQRVREKSLRPLSGVLRAAAAFLVVGIVGLVVVIVVLIGLVRLFDTDVFAGRVWATDALLAGMFLTGAVFLLRQGARAKNR